MKRRQAGVSFIELLVAIAVVAVIVPAVTIAVSYGIRYESRLETSRLPTTDRNTFEDKLRALIEPAFIRGTATDTTTYFILKASSNSVDATADTLTLTTSNYHPMGSFLRSQDNFEEINRDFGPQGGIKEISLSLTPVGDAGDVTGLFLREQRPSDGDPTQGGVESVLNADIDTIRFQCWDGIEWITSWDTTTMTPPRLPAAVQVTYKLKNQDEERVLVVRIPLSDVTTDKPITTTSGTGGTTP